MRTKFRSSPRALATLLANVRAVPLGASFLWRWCISTISQSNSRKILAASRANLFSTATPRLVFVAYKIGINLAHSSIKFSVDSSSPVVPMQRGFGFFMAKFSKFCVPLGLEKSIITSEFLNKSSKFPLSLSNLAPTTAKFSSDFKHSSIMRPILPLAP